MTTDSKQQTLDYEEVFNFSGIKSSTKLRLHRGAEKLPLYFAKSLGKHVYILGVNKDGSLIANTVNLDQFQTIIEDFVVQN